MISEKVEVVVVTLVDVSFIIEFILFIRGLFVHSTTVSVWKIFQLFFMFLFCVMATYGLLKKKKSVFEKFFNEDGTVKEEYEKYLKERKKNCDFAISNDTKFFLIKICFDSILKKGYNSHCSQLSLTRQVCS